MDFDNPFACLSLKMDRILFKTFWTNKANHKSRNTSILNASPNQNLAYNRSSSEISLSYSLTAFLKPYAIPPPSL